MNPKTFVSSSLRQLSISFSKSVNNTIDIDGCKKIYKIISEYSELKATKFEFEFNRLCKKYNADEKWKLEIYTVIDLIKKTIDNTNLENNSTHSYLSQSEKSKRTKNAFKEFQNKVIENNTKYLKNDNKIYNGQEYVNEIKNTKVDKEIDKEIEIDKDGGRDIDNAHDDSIYYMRDLKESKRGGQPIGNCQYIENFVELSNYVKESYGEEINLSPSLELPNCIVNEITKWFDNQPRKPYSTLNSLCLFFRCLIDESNKIENEKYEYFKFKKWMNASYIKQICRTCKNEQYTKLIEAIKTFQDIDFDTKDNWSIKIPKNESKINIEEMLNEQGKLSTKMSILKTMNLIDWQPEMYKYDKDVVNKIINKVGKSREETIKEFYDNLYIYYMRDLKELKIPENVIESDIQSINNFFDLKEKSLSLLDYRWSMSGYRTYGPLIGLSKRVRNILFPDYMEIDVANCHWMLMVNHLITKYSTRDYEAELALLRGVEDIYLVFGIDDRDDAKKALNALINAPYSKPMIESMGEEIELWENAVKIIKWLEDNAPNLSKSFWIWKKTSSPHKDLTKIEQELIFQCNVRANANGMNQHDGIMVLSDSNSFDIFKNAFDKYIENWEYKPTLKIKRPEFTWNPKEIIYK